MKKSKWSADSTETEKGNYGENLVASEIFVDGVHLYLPEEGCGHPIDGMIFSWAVNKIIEFFDVKSKWTKVAYKRTGYDKSSHKRYMNIANANPDAEVNVYFVDAHPDYKCIWKGDVRSIDADKQDAKDQRGDAIYTFHTSKLIKVRDLTDEEVNAINEDDDQNASNQSFYDKWDGEPRDNERGYNTEYPIHTDDRVGQTFVTI